MLNVACGLYVSMIASWYLAACVGGTSMWMRWVLLAMALPTMMIVYLTRERRVRLCDALKPLGCLVGYGLVSGLASQFVGLAVAKSLAFGATTFACLLGGALLVERFGRDRVLEGWRLSWQAFLLYSAIAVAVGAWRSADVGLYGPTDNPNMYGSLIATLGAILLLPLRADENRGPGHYLQLGIGLALLLATRSRSAMLGVAMAAATVVLAGSGSRRWLWVGAIVFAVGAALIVVPRTAVVSAERVVRKAPGTGPESDMPGVFASRASAWEESWNAMLEGLPLGFGWGVKQKPTRIWTADFQTLGYGREEGTSWLPVGEELGLPGLVLVAWLWWSLLRAAASQPFRGRLLAYAMLAILFSIGSFEGWFLSPGNWETMAFWSSLGILCARPATIRATPGLLQSGGDPLVTAGAA